MFAARASAIVFLTTAFACQTHTMPTTKLPDSHQAHSAHSTQYCPPSPVNHDEQMKIFGDFVQVFYTEKNINGTAAHLDVNYIQHNIDVLNGRQAFVDAFSAAAGGNSTTTIVHMALQNDIAWVHYKSTTPGSPLTAIVDVFRFNGSCIMEHWDVIESLPTNAPNPKALF
ncbi:snoal-like polyketide cyclase family [Curvularia clavata]|uniref:Snoal-like polyketide cyclase family n=1 Tax=Curvularia clavata TaxID=95742 RepID=A0A9Q9DXF0_CURCL|nr:snoal-like polyketide cyclase family [Curvularia clavata]